MRKHHPLLVTGALLLLTACGNTQDNATAPATEETSAPTINTPEGFADTATYHLDQQLLQGEEATTHISKDGTQLVQNNDNSLLYSNLTEQNVNNFTVEDYGELYSTSTGFTPDGKTALVLAAGKKTGEAASNNSDTWAVYSLTANGLEKIEERPLDRQDSTVLLSEAGTITITEPSSVEPDQVFTVSNDLKVNEHSNTSKSFNNCGSGQCELDTTVLMETQNGLPRSYIEPGHGTKHA